MISNLSMPIYMYISYKEKIIILIPVKWSFLLSLRKSRLVYVYIVNRYYACSSLSIYICMFIMFIGMFYSQYWLMKTRVCFTPFGKINLGPVLFEQVICLCHLSSCFSFLWLHLYNQNMRMTMYTRCHLHSIDCLIKFL